MNSLWPALTGEYLANLANIKINIINRMDSGYGGERKSNARGNSLEFSDFRDYAPGDDGARVDWNSFARLGRLYTKVFEEEKRAVINVFIDTSASMGFSGDASKLYFSKLFAASAAYISLRNSDKINVMAMDKPDSERYTGSSFTDLIGFLDGLGAGGGKSLNPHIILKPGASIIISDFMFGDGYQNEIQLLQSKKQAVTLVHVLSRGELEADVPEGSIRITDSETGGFRDIEMSRSLADAYTAALDEFMAEIRGFCIKRGIRYILAPTDTNILKHIAALAR